MRTAATILGISTHTTRKLIKAKEGTLRSIRVGRLLFVSKDAIREWLAAQSRAGYVARPSYDRRTTSSYSRTVMSGVETTPQHEVMTMVMLRLVQADRQTKARRPISRSTGLNAEVQL